MKHVQVQNADMAWHIAANVQFPPAFDESKQYPTIISVHPFGRCKEQTSSNVYGKALAEVLLTQPVMVVVGEKAGAFGACRDGLEIYGRAVVSRSLPHSWSNTL